MVRMLSDVKGETYEEKLIDAGLTTLKERRIRGDLIETFKTLKGFNNIEKRAWFAIVEDNQARPNTRANTEVTMEGRQERKLDVLEVQRSRLEIRRNFFTVRVVKQWNELPESVKSSRSINAFKNAYDSWKKKN